MQETSYVENNAHLNQISPIYLFINHSAVHQQKHHHYTLFKEDETHIRKWFYGYPDFMSTWNVILMLDGLQLLIVRSADLLPT
jgi:hypothetical protein